MNITYCYVAFSCLWFASADVGHITYSAAAYDKATALARLLSVIPQVPA